MLGCDIVEIDRVKSGLENFKDRFVNKILSLREIEVFIKRGKKAEFLAGRFSAKEAVSKAFRTGIGGKLSFQDISILPDENGALDVYINEVKRDDILVSISHSKEYAIAVCILKEGINECSSNFSGV